MLSRLQGWVLGLRIGRLLVGELWIDWAFSRGAVGHLLLRVVARVGRMRGANQIVAWSCVAGGAAADIEVFVFLVGGAVVVDV